MRWESSCCVLSCCHLLSFAVLQCTLYTDHCTAHLLLNMSLSMQYRKCGNDQNDVLYNSTHYCALWAARSIWRGLPRPPRNRRPNTRLRGCIASRKLARGPEVLHRLLQRKRVCLYVCAAVSRWDDVVMTLWYDDVGRLSTCTGMWSIPPPPRRRECTMYVKVHQCQVTFQVNHAYRNRILLHISTCTMTCVRLFSGDVSTDSTHVYTHTRTLTCTARRLHVVLALYY